MKRRKPSRGRSKTPTLNQLVERDPLKGKEVQGKEWITKAKQPPIKGCTLPKKPDNLVVQSNVTTLGTTELVLMGESRKQETVGTLAGSSSDKSS